MFIMKSLFIGRFQPFHNGHLKVIKHLSTTYEEIIIGIGSSQYHNESENPFTADERKKMIEESMYHAISKSTLIKGYKHLFECWIF